MATLSVALCTYNGALFLDEQLRSIGSQSRLPDQLVIVDDCSTDGSVSLARRYSERAPFAVEVHQNAQNIGYAANFDRAIRQCTGEVIVLCDQDDVWLPEKLARLEAAFSASESVGLAFSDAELVDARLRPLGTRLWDAVGFHARRRARARQGEMFGVLLQGNVVTGATMAFRRSLRELVLPIEAGCDHDAWIAILCSAVAEVRLVDEPLVYYRQHADNQIGARRLNVWKRWQRARRLGLEVLRSRWEYHQRLLSRLEEREDVPSDRLRALRDAVEHIRVRAMLPSQRLRRLPPIARELISGRYALAGQGVISAARDLLV